MTIWLTSDPHWDHTKIIEYDKRPFTDLEHMQREMIARHNAIVAKEDTVINAGDFSLSEKTVPVILPYLNGKHTLVCGNHDKPHACHKKAEAAKRRYLVYGFVDVLQQMRMEPFLICHLPYAGDSKEIERYSQWRPKDTGGWLLHGHVHDLWKVKGRMINVGVPVWDYAPIQFETLLALMEEKQ